LGSISRLNTRLASAPVNASPVSSRTPAHDSGSEWVASPSLYRTSTNYTPPAFNGAPRLDPILCSDNGRSRYTASTGAAPRKVKRQDATPLFPPLFPCIISIISGRQAVSDIRPKGSRRLLISAEGKLDEDRLVVTLELPRGTGESSDPCLSLARPFHRRLQEGRQMGTINYVFLEMGDHLRTLGALCHSAGKQVIFFPGLAARTPIWQARGGARVSLHPAAGTTLDHISLEKDRKHWHPRYLAPDGLRARPTQGNEVAERFPTSRQDDFTFWFAMQISRPAELELTPARFHFAVSGTALDLESKAADMIAARDGAEFHVLELHPESNDWNQGHLAVAFVFDHSGATTLTSENSTVLKQHAFVPCQMNPSASVPRRIERQPVRLHPVRIPGLGATIWITTALLPSQHQAQAVFSSYS